MRQLLTEGFCWPCWARRAACCWHGLMLDLMRAFLIHALARGADIHMNWPVLTAAIAAAICTSLAASLFPALRLSSIDPNRALKGGGSAGTQRGQYRMRSVFVITQVALTLVLLVVSGMLIRVVTRYRDVDLGFDPSHILSVKLNISRPRYQDRDVLSAFYKPLEERASHLPGVQAAGLINILPIESWGSNSRHSYRRSAARAAQPGCPRREPFRQPRLLRCDGHSAAPWTQALSEPRLVRHIAATVVVNEAFVREFIPAGLDPTAQRIDSDEKNRSNGRRSSVSPETSGKTSTNRLWRSAIG